MATKTYKILAKEQSYIKQLVLCDVDAFELIFHTRLIKPDIYIEWFAKENGLILEKDHLIYILDEIADEGFLEKYKTDKGPIYEII